MTKLVLDCNSLQSIGDQIQALSENMNNTADSITSYSIKDTDFDFVSAKNSIALNVKGAVKKIKNTSKLIDSVIDAHVNLQNTLKFTVPSTTTNQTKTSSVTPSFSKNPKVNSTSFSKKSSTISSVGSNAFTTIKPETLASSTISVDPSYLSTSAVNKSTISSSETINISNIEGTKTINIPEGLGKQHTYMGWQMITSPTSNQYKFRETVGMNFDEEGFGKVGDRYVIACTSTFGEVGDLIDFQQSDGTIIKCIIGDIKSQSVTSYDRNPADMWGHNDGKCIVEFIVDKNTWYNTNHENPGNSTCHPEWNDYIVSATNYGSYYDIV